MKRVLKLWLVVALSVPPVVSWAQINTAYLDSIPFAKPKQTKLFYTFNHPALQSIKIKPTKRKAGTYSPGAAMKDMGADLAASLFGHFTGFTTSREVIWQLESRLVANDKRFNWDIIVLCPGELYKEKEHQHDPATGEDAVVTVAYVEIFWEEGAAGIIKENEQIIGSFKVVVDPAADSSLFETYYDVFQDPPRNLRTKARNSFYQQALEVQFREYAVLGKFRGEEFALVSNGVSHSMWFFINDVLACVFYSDLDALPVHKDDRVMPYLLLDPDIPDEKLADWYRLAMFSRFLYAEVNN